MTDTATKKRTTPEVGDILYASWGYDQTNIDYFQVVGISKSGQSVQLRAIHASFVERNGPYGDKVVPVKDSFIDGWHSFQSEIRKEDGTPKWKRIREGWRGDGYQVRLTTYANAYLTDGSPKNQTDPMFGH